MAKWIELTLAEGGRLVLNTDHIAAITESAGDFGNARSVVTVTNGKFSVADEIDLITNKAGISI